MKRSDTDITTTLEAESIIDVLRLAGIGRILHAGHANYEHTVKRWDVVEELELPDSFRMDRRKPYGIHTLTYQNADLKRIHGMLGEYMTRRKQ